MGVVYCPVPGCMSKNFGKIKFFSFRVEWGPIIRESCGMPDYVIPKQSAICMRHFEKRFLREKQIQNERLGLIIDYRLSRGAYPTIFHNDILFRQTLCTREEDGRKDGDLDTRIYNYSVSSVPKSNMINTPQIASQSTSNGGIFNGALPSTQPTINSHEISPLEPQILNSETLNVRCQKVEELSIGPEHKSLLSASDNLSRLSGVKVESENSIISENEQPKIKSESDEHCSPEINFIKQEVIDDEVERITEDHIVEKANYLPTDIKVEQNVLDLDVNTGAGQITIPAARLDENVLIKEILSDCSSIVINLNKHSSNEHESDISSNENSQTGHGTKDMTVIEKESTKMVDHFKFGSSVFVNEILKDLDARELAQSEIIPENLDRSAGPSRFDCDVLNDAMNQVDSMNENKLMIQHKKEMKKEFFGDDAEANGLTESTNSDCAMEESNMKKRQGSPLNVEQIKKEKIDDEVDTNGQILPLNQVFVKSELEEENSVHTKSQDVAVGKNTSSLGLLEKTGKVWGEERINKCVLCDLYLYGTVKEHIMERHQDGIFFTCPYCDFDSVKSIKCTKAEAKRHKEIFQIDCEFCGETCPNWITLTIHISNEHNEKMNNTCTICGFKAYGYGTLIQHIIIRHNSETLTHCCQHCNFSTMNSSLFKHHVEAKHTKPPQTSSENTTKSIQPREPPKVRKKMTKKCPCCDFKTLQKVYLLKHMLEAHPRE